MLDELIANIVAKLNITPDQAKAGLGMVLRFAQTELGPKFDAVKSYLPGADELIAAAPQAGGMGAMLGGLGGMFGGEASKLGGLASLLGSAEKVDLSKEHLLQIGQQAADMVKSQGGAEAADMLKGLIK